MLGAGLQAERCGADVIADFLQAHNIGTVFALAGASFAYLLRALEARGIAVVPSRHESATVAAADGYARITGKLGVAMIIADQGVPNAIGALASAYYASSPVLVLSAKLPLAWEEAEGEVDLDANALVRPISKWARNIPDANRIAEYCFAAAKRATYGRPGPVVLNFDQDILAQGVAAEDRPVVLDPQSPTVMSDDMCSHVVELLKEAKRPIIIAGSEATRKGAGEALRKLASRGIAVLGNGLGRGLVPEDDISGFSWPYAQYAAWQADLVIFVGARPTRRFGFALPPRLAAEAVIMQIDSQPEFLHRNRKMDVAVAADIAAACAQIEKGCDEAQLQFSTNWLVEALAERKQAVAELAGRSEGAIHPSEMVAAVQRHTPDNAIIIGDGADIQNWAYGVQRVKQAPGFVEHYPLGSMGIGMPLAVGAAAGAREIAGDGAPRPVIMVTGDGSFGFYPSELQSAAQAGLKITVLIANDAAWGTELHGQQKVLGKDYNTSLTPSRYERIAHAFDLAGYYVDDRGDLETAITSALAAETSAVVNVMIDQQAGAALKNDKLVNMILFSEVTEGIANLQKSAR